MLEFGLEHPGTYMKSKQEGLIDHGKHYPSSNFNDELSWGAIWLYFATGVSMNANDAVVPHSRSIPFCVEDICLVGLPCVPKSAAVPGIHMCYTLSQLDAGSAVKFCAGKVLFGDAWPSGLALGALGVCSQLM